MRLLRVMVLNVQITCGSFSLPQEVHVNEFDIVEEVLRPLWETMLVDAEGCTLAHQFFQLSVKLVVARV